MVERRKPIVTELALADALDRLVNLSRSCGPTWTSTWRSPPTRPTW